MYTLLDLLTTNAFAAAKRTAVIDRADRVSYAELYERARRSAKLFARRTDPGDRVAILLPRSTDALAVFFGLYQAAAVPVFIHDQLRPRQVAHIVRAKRKVVSAGHEVF
ncbi:MAG: AMP-binding protein [Pseudonocardiaceae bacterium]